MKNGTKKKWNPSPIIFFSFSTSFSLYLPLTTSAALSWTSRHILLPPDCSDALTHSLSHGVNRAGSLSRLPIEESSAHKHTQACVFIPSHGDYICASPRISIFVLMLSPISEHTRQLRSPDYILHCNKDSSTKYVDFVKRNPISQAI